MVYYDAERHAAQTPPPVCPKCGSHRTKVVGRSDDGKTVTVRCGSCGEGSRINIGDLGTRSSDPAVVESADADFLGS
jgi:hypothetical protein